MQMIDVFTVLLHLIAKSSMLLFTLFFWTNDVSLDFYTDINSYCYSIFALNSYMKYVFDSFTPVISI